jgi:hypothetical protein
MSESPTLTLPLVFGVFFDVTRKNSGIIFLTLMKQSRAKYPGRRDARKAGLDRREGMRPRTPVGYCSGVWCRQTYGGWKRGTREGVPHGRPSKSLAAGFAPIMHLKAYGPKTCETCEKLRTLHGFQSPRMFSAGDLDVAARSRPVQMWRPWHALTFRHAVSRDLSRKHMSCRNLT